MRFSKRELARRRKGIGASEAPAVLGVDPHRTALDIWGAKVGVDVGTREVGDEASWGDRLEPVILAQYAEETGRQVAYTRKKRVLQHPKIPILFASPDVLDVKARRLVEVKVDRWGRDYGEPGTDEIPLSVKIQVLQQLEVSGYEVADVAALIGGTAFRIYTVEASRTRQDALVSALVEWWDRYVVTGEPPADEPSERARYLAGRYRSDNGQELVATTELEELVEAYRIALEAVAMSERVAHRYRNAIAEAMGEHARLLGSFGRIDWRQTSESTRTDWKLVAKDLRGLVEQMDRDAARNS